MQNPEPKCPHCKGELRMWINKRKQRNYGRCKTCKKVVDLGKVSNEEKGAELQTSKTASGKTSPAPRGTGRVKRIAHAGAGKAEQRPVRSGNDLPEQLAAKPKGFFDSVLDFLNREW